MSSPRHIAVLLGVLLALAMPATALGSPTGVIRDCNKDGKLDKKYSKQDLKKALKKLPSDIKEYSDCSDVIRAAIDQAGPGAAGGGGGGAGPTAGPTAADTAALKEATGGDKPPAVKVGGKRVEPGENGLFNLDTASNDVPLPLALALIAVGLLTLGGGYMALRRRFPALANLSLKPRLPSLRRVPFARFRR
jgi:hypothetical protein